MDGVVPLLNGAVVPDVGRTVGSRNACHVRARGALPSSTGRRTGSGSECDS
jgi:hypothetical protein